jgi:hypothetical protein
MASSDYSFFNICWEFVLHDNVIMQVLFKVFSALVTSVTIVDRKYLNLGPLIVRYLLSLGLRLYNIQDDGNSILVRLANETDVSVRSKGAHRAKLLLCSLRILEHGKLRSTADA